MQVACAPGDEAVARRFWVEGLGFEEVAKPAVLAARGGAWFRAYDASGAVTAEVHVGVEDPFRPARKAHPALVVGSVEELETTGRRLEEQGFEVDRSQRGSFPGHERLHAFDGHGNRVELLAPLEAPSG